MLVYSAEELYGSYIFSLFDSISSLTRPLHAPYVSSHDDDQCGGTTWTWQAAQVGV